MINIYRERNNIVIHYNTMDGVKKLVKKYKPFKIVKDPNGEYWDLTGGRWKKGYGVQAYNCMSKDKNNKYTMFLNTCLDLSDEFIEELIEPSLVFYDIETNEYAVPEIDDGTIFKSNSKSIINSIAWVNYQTKETICLVNGVDGDEKFIIKSFLEYCVNNDIIGIAGFNNFGFDDKVMQSRAKHHHLKNTNILYSACNIDVMLLSKAFNYSSGNRISLNNLASLLNLNESKTETGIYNPITLYNEGLKYENKLKLFRKYNIMDVKLTISVFEHIDSMNTLVELFKQSKAPFNTVKGTPTYLLNSYICNKAYNENIVIPETKEIPNNIEYGGGLHYYDEKSKMEIFNNVAVFDIISFYPNIMRILKMNPFYDYPNINKDTGAIGKFDDDLPNGYIGEVAEELFLDRIATKKLMKKQVKGSDEYNILYKKNLTKKILVNSMYGAISKDFFVLKNSYLAKIITAIGRDLLEKIIHKFGGIYGKTDSVFIPVAKEDTSVLLKDINDFITSYLKSKYNLNNILPEDGAVLIQMECDSYLDKFIIKDKNNYIKIIKDEVILKGGSFTKNNFSEFVNDIIERIVNFVLNDESDEYIITDILDFTKESLKNNKPITYYAEKYKLSSKEKNHQKNLGRQYMDDNNIPYTFNFLYCCCRVTNIEYDYVVYPLNYEPSDLTIEKLYVYEIAINKLKELKIINDDEATELINEFETKYPRIEKGQTTLEGYYMKKYDNLDVFDFIDPKKVKSKILLSMQEFIPDTFEAINKDLLKFIVVNRNTKEAIIPYGFTYANDSSSLNQNNFKYPNQLLGLIRGYNNIKDYNNKIAILDIDGAKDILDKPTNKRLKDYLYDILKSIDYPFIIWKSSSKTGYHLVYVTNISDEYNLSHIYYPDDFFIPELRGQSLGNGTIEVLEKQNGFVKLPSDFKNHLVSEDNSWKKLFNNPINIHHAIDEVFKEKGFKVEAYNYTREPSLYHQTSKEHIILSSDELIILSDCISELFVIAMKQNLNKSDLALAIGGWLSNHINYECLDELLELIIKKAVINNKGIFKNNNQFKKIIKNSYKRNNVKKKGLKTVKNMFHHEYDKIHYLINKMVEVNNKAYYNALPLTHLEEVKI